MANGTGFTDAIDISAAYNGTVVTISPTTPDIYFQLNTVDGVEYVFGTQGTLDTYVHLYNSAQHQIAYDDDSGGSRQVRLVFIGDGTKKYIRLRGYSTPSSATPVTVLFSVQEPQAGTGGFSDALDVNLDERITVRLSNTYSVYLRVGVGELLFDEDYDMTLYNSSTVNTARVEIYDAQENLVYDSGTTYRTAAYLNNAVPRYRNNGQNFYYIKLTGNRLVAWDIMPFFAKRIREVRLLANSYTFIGHAPVTVTAYVAPTDAYDVTAITLNAPSGLLWPSRPAIEGNIASYDMFCPEAGIISAGDVLTLEMYTVKTANSFPNMPAPVPIYYEEANYFVGSGTPEDPYLIATLEDLQNVRTNMSAHYRQIADVDVTGTNWIPAGLASAYVSYPAINFNGSYDGGGFSIIGLNNPLFYELSVWRLEDEENQRILMKGINFVNPNIVMALPHGSNSFGVMSFTMQNVTLEDCHVIGAYLEGNQVGGFTDYYNASIPGMALLRCSFQGEIRAVSMAAGFATSCYHLTSVVDCSFEITATPLVNTTRLSVAGIAYYLTTYFYDLAEVVTITLRNIKSNITALLGSVGNYVGGLASYCYPNDSLVVVKDIEASVTCTGAYYMGGIFAYYSGPPDAFNLSMQDIKAVIDYNYAGAPDPYVNQVIGGIIGTIWGASDNIKNIEVTGSIAGKDASYYIGGFIGYLHTQKDYFIVERCKVLVDIEITVNDLSVHDNSNVGGFIGYCYGLHLFQSYFHGIVATKGASNVGSGFGYIGDSHVEQVYTFSPVLKGHADDYLLMGALTGNAYNSTFRNCVAIVQDYIHIMEDPDTSNVPADFLGWDYENVKENLLRLTTMPIPPNTVINSTGTVTPEETRRRATYESIGWDFVKTWGIQENESFPYFITAPLVCIAIALEQLDIHRMNIRQGGGIPL